MLLTMSWDLMQVLQPQMMRNLERDFLQEVEVVEEAEVEEEVAEANPEMEKEKRTHQENKLQEGEEAAKSLSLMIQTSHHSGNLNL